MFRLLFAALLFSVGLGFSHTRTAAEDKEKDKDKPAAQKYCPVMLKDEIDPKVSESVMYKGVKIYLCCGTCVSKFKRDPAAYLDPKFIPGLAGMELPKRDIEQMYCPVVKDRKISSKDPSTTYKGVKIYFYTDVARQRFEKDPERYIDMDILPQLKKKP